jgi:hypothetical protein
MGAINAMVALYRLIAMVILFFRVSEKYILDI